MEDYTIEKFIEDLNNISDDKKKLPLVIQTPNGMQVKPVIKMLFKEDIPPWAGGSLEKMVVTFNDW